MMNSAHVHLQTPNIVSLSQLSIGFSQEYWPKAVSPLDRLRFLIKGVTLSFGDFHIHIRHGNPPNHYSVLLLRTLFVGALVLACALVFAGALVLAFAAGVSDATALSIMAAAIFCCFRCA